MWVLLSGGLRRWIIFSLTVPIAARLLGAAGHRLEARDGPTHLSRGLQRAGRLASAKRSDAKSSDNATTSKSGTTIGRPSRGSEKTRGSLRRWNR